LAASWVLDQPELYGKALFQKNKTFKKNKNKKRTTDTFNKVDDS
jgi:hypothetical protein